MSIFQKGIVSFSIDDGSEDGYRLYKLLSRYGICGTYNIVTSWIGREGYMTLDQLTEIYNDPLMEIACHGYSHKNDDEDILKGNAQLREWFGSSGDGLIGFASPGSAMKKPFVLENERHLRDELGFLYVRSYYDPDPDSRKSELIELYRANGASEHITKRVIPQLIYGFSGIFVPSVVIYGYTELDDLKVAADLAAQERACAIFMLHRVKKQGEDNYDDKYSFDYDKLEEFLRHVKRRMDGGELETLTTRGAFEAGRG